MFVACNSADQNCSSILFRFDNQKYQAKGCADNNLEKGEWSFYNAKNKLIEKGNYENGIRVGKWLYPENKSDSIIVWKKYEKQNLKLLFNIPVLLEVVEDTLEYIKFSNKDSSKLFNVVLSVHELEESKKQIENYYKQGEEEITANGWSFAYKRNEVIAGERTLYFNDYIITISESNKFKVLNAYSLMKDKKLFEISCRFSENIESSARIIFFSLLSNCFYNTERFIDPLEEIKTITTN